MISKTTIGTVRPLRQGCRGVVLLLAASVSLVAPPARAEDEFRWLRLRMTEAGVNVEVEWEHETRKLKGNPNSFERGYLYVSPMVELGLEGSIYHPNLALFKIRIEDGLSWQQQYLNQPVGAASAGTESETRFLQRYRFSLDLLKEKPYAASFFAEKDHNFRQFDFFNRVTVDNQRYGGRLGYSEGPLPFHVSFTHLDEDITGFTRPSTLEENTLTFDLRNERHRNSITSLSYMLDQYDRQEAGIAIQKGTYHTVNLSDHEVWGKNDRMRLNSSLFYSRLDDSPVPTRNFTLVEHLGIEHTKKLASDYNYNYDRRSSGSSDSEGHTGQASVRYRWRERLTAALDVHGMTFNTASPGMELSGRRYGVGWSGTYHQPVAAWSDLTLGYSGRFDRESRQTTGQTLTVIGERHTLTDGIVTYLKQPRVVASSIRVTDSTGKEFIRLLDYLVISHGDLTEIRRAPNASQIPNGSAVQVDYAAYLEPSDDFTTLAQQFQVRVDFFNHLLGVYGRLNLVDNRGARYLLTQNVTDKVAGADFSWRWFRAGGEYESFDSNLGSFESKRLFQSFNIEPTSASHLSLDLDQNWTTFKDDGRRRTAYNFIARYNTRFTSHLAWNVEGGFRLERGQGFDQTLGLLRTSLAYNRGKLAVKLGFDLQDQDYLGELRRRNFFYLEARRSF